ncbi:hypothetical protein [Hymenobacter nivis]|uniref:Uncharacterized protein n=1 Tax=Hymenobacter nivis TaxID=1850093 RepID=A0A502H157_9BACT|nr:hypothetical protein [Hymenobacter nivis]TPG67096.1 hypothetical protein EAH73_04995 [Hymenobacter nivis]
MKLVPRLRCTLLWVTLLLLGAPGARAQAARPESVFDGAPLESIEVRKEASVLLDKEFYTNQLFLLGEAHEVRGPRTLILPC